MQTFTNKYFGASDPSENAYAHILDQHVNTWADPRFQLVNCKTPVFDRWEDLNVSPFATSLGPSVRPPDVVKARDNGAGSIRPL
jgi:hypothetical protein